MRVGSKGRRKAPSTGLGEGGREFERWHRRERKRAGEERAGAARVARVARVKRRRWAAWVR